MQKIKNDLPSFPTLGWLFFVAGIVYWILAFLCNQGVHLSSKWNGAPKWALDLQAAALGNRAWLFFILALVVYIVDRLEKQQKEE